MKHIIMSVLLFACSVATLQAQQVSLKYWKIEDHSKQMSIEVSGDTLDITSPKGVTMWYTPRLTGNYEISYTVRVIMNNGPYDRLSDLNCFWGANDPKHPNDLYAQSEWREGFFPKYKSLELYYVGYGGNHNSSTRFRKYYGLGMEVDDDITRPIIQGYDAPEYLLKPNKWMEIVIRVENEETTYIVDGKALFQHPIKKGGCDGNFGFRLLENHIQFTDFKIKKL